MRQAARHGSGTFTSYRYISSGRTYNAICQVSACAGSQMRCGSSYGTCLRPRCSPVAVLNDRLPRMSYITASIRHLPYQASVQSRVWPCESDSLPRSHQRQAGSAAVDVSELRAKLPDFIRRCFSRENLPHINCCRQVGQMAAAGMHGWLAVDVLISTPIKCLFRGDGTKKKKCGV
jgi:hypothetical protein